MATNDPLKNPKKPDQTDNTLKGLKSEITKPSLFVDPLSSKKVNPLASKSQLPVKKTNDPLSKAANFTAAKSEFNENVDADKKPFEIIKSTDATSAVKDRVIEFKNAEKKKEIGLWSGIRTDFVKIFDLKNMEHFINNVRKIEN